MEFRRLVLLSALFCLALLGSHVQASLPAEDYWQALWPNTPMPKALRDILQPDATTYQTGYRKVSNPTRSKDTVPNGVFVFVHDLESTGHSYEPDTVAKTFPFYLYGKGRDFTRSTIPKTFPFYLYGKGSKSSDITRSTIPKTFPFYLYGKGSESSENDVTKSTIPKTFPFYLYGKGSESSENDITRSTIPKTFPFYLYGKGSESSENDVTKSTIPKTFPFYLYGKGSESSDITTSTVPKTFPFYLYGKGSESSENDITRSIIPKTFPFYLYGNGRDLTRSTVPKTFPFYLYGKGSDLTENTIPKTFPFYLYGKRRDLTRSKDTIPNGTFFFEHDLLPGKKLNLEPTKPSDEFTFLPDTVARTIPFSSSRLPEILNRFSIETKSTDAETVKHTLEICESASMHGEEKYCAKSLESLVNFAVSKLGKNTRLLSTEFEKGTQSRQYSVMEGVRKNGDKAVVCHKMDYPYAVFYCHKIDTRSYTVPLVAAGDGTKAKALAVCHTDTTHWHPEHIAFKQLNVKPGTLPICHFLATDTVLWVPNLALKGMMESSPEEGKR